MRILPIADNNYSIEFGNLRKRFQERKELRQKQAEQRNAFEADLINNSDRYVAAYKVKNLQTDLDFLKSHQNKLLAERAVLNRRISELDSEIYNKGAELVCGMAEYYSYEPDSSNFANDAKKGAIISHRREAELSTQSNDGFDWGCVDTLYQPYNNPY